MHATSHQSRNLAFFVLVALFVAILAIAWTDLLPFPALVVLGCGFLLLGPVLVVLTLKLKEPPLQKTFFLLAGTSAAAIPICIMLHNLVYGLFIWWFGEGFWKLHGGDEAVFFIMALFVFPALFSVGVIGSIVILIKASFTKQ